MVDENIRSPPRQRLTQMNPDFKSLRPRRSHRSTRHRFPRRRRHGASHRVLQKFPKKAKPPRVGRARLDCQEAGPRPGRHEAAEPAETDKRQKTRLSGARSGSHDAVEGERGGGAGSGGALAQKEMWRGDTWI
jgi:hypothetical protein